MAIRIRHIARALMLILGICMFSCAKNSTAEMPVSELDGKTAFSFEFQVPMLREGQYGYVDGNAAENYIDIEHNGFRIYFFDTNNRYLSCLNTISASAVDGTDCREYKVTGIVMDDVSLGSSFKVVVLANWPRYPVNLETGATTIDDICTDNAALFGYSSDFELDAGAGRLMPFYGVHEYSDITFTDGEYTLLPEPVTLLRAMAKIEIRTAAGSLPITGAVLTYANDRGFSAPRNVYRQSQYDKGVYSEDFVSSISLPGSANVLNDIPLHEMSEGIYMLYVPEYDNTSAGARKAQIRLSFVDTYAETCLVDFAFYDALAAQQSNANVGDAFDIRRNYYYVYTVNKRPDTELNLIVDVIPYSVVNLPPLFGLEIDDDGNHIDKAGNILVIGKDGYIIVKITPGGSIVKRDGTPVTLDATGHYAAKDAEGKTLWEIEKTENRYLVRDGNGILITSVSIHN